MEDMSATTRDFSVSDVSQYLSTCPRQRPIHASFHASNDRIRPPGRLVSSISAGRTCIGERNHGRGTLFKHRRPVRCSLVTSALGIVYRRAHFLYIRRLQEQAEKHPLRQTEPISEFPSDFARDAALNRPERSSGDTDTARRCSTVRTHVEGAKRYLRSPNNEQQAWNMTACRCKVAQLSTLCSAHIALTMP
ncbi:hypothetical protein OH76DRAFT_639414 [Lentinus brumalis]|uniref:Uncharacterized protein n=1 Tax=Lentinus brumalis TaxID=2498619 RepID=A0A371CH89_9APHY|nr:hypothetical protein OH76DRAFT_639414 [Polyporus brumalis]